MNSREKDTVLCETLKFCLDEARTMSEILSAPAIQPIVAKRGAYAVKRLIYGLHDTGLLFMRGTTRSAYRTTERGASAIPLYETDKDPAG